MTLKQSKKVSIRDRSSQLITTVKRLVISLCASEKRPNLKSCFAVAAVFISMQAAAELPSVKFMTAPLVSPDVAIQYYNNFPNPTRHSVSVPGFARATEIKTLAKGLGKGQVTDDVYAQRVYEYVYNNIGVDFMFGMTKGPLGALVDQSGTPFDQAALMFELLREANIAASYQVGTITLNAAQVSQWIGLTNAVATCRLLADGGIPATVNGSSSATCSLSGNVTSVTMLHVWVSALTKRYDPSYKVHTNKTGIDLATALQCGITTGCSGSLSSMRSQATSAATSTSDVTLLPGSTNAIRNVAQSSLDTQLSTWAMKLKAKLDAQYPNAELSDIIGGQAISASSMPAVGVLPYGSPTAANTWSEIPDQYRSTLRVQYDSIDTTLFADEIAGRRLRLFVSDYVRYSGSELDRASSLYLELQRVAHSYRTDGNQNNDVMRLYVNHPYAAQTGSSPGSYMDETITVGGSIAPDISGWQPPSEDIGPVYFSSYQATIVHGWGRKQASAIAHISSLVNRDVPGVALSFGDGPDGEYAVCDGPDAGVSAGRLPHFTSAITTISERCLRSERSAHAEQWLAEVSRASELVDKVNSTRTAHHHSVGVITWNDAFSVESSFSTTSQLNNPADKRAANYSIGLIASRLEGGISEQLTSVWDGGSPVSSAARGNDIGGRLAKYDSVAGINGSSVDQADKAKLTGIVQEGYSVIFPHNWDTVYTFPYKVKRPGPGFGGSWTFFLRRPLYAVRTIGADAIPDRIALLMEAQWTGAGNPFTKGTNGNSIADNPLKATLETTKLQDISGKARKYYNVSLNSGSLNITPPSDLVTGAGAFPFQLAFQRFYDSSKGMTPSGFQMKELDDKRDCSNDGYHCDKYGVFSYSNESSAIGGGWENNWHITASLTSDAFKGMGSESPVSAVSALSSLYTLRALASTAPSFNDFVTSMFVAHWFGTQLNENAVVISRPPKSQSFTRLPDGSFVAPGTGEKLEVQGARLGPYGKQPDVTTPVVPVLYDYRSLQLKLTDSSGAELGFNIAQDDIFPGDTLGFKQFKITNWRFPSGAVISFGYDSSTQPQCLTLVSNNVGRSLIFEREAVTYGSIYGGLVQKNPDGQCYLRRVSDGDGRSVEYQRPGAVGATGQTGSSAYFGGLFRMPELSVVGPLGVIARYQYADSYDDSVRIRAANVLTRAFSAADNYPYLSVNYDELFRVRTLTDALNNPSDFFIGGGFGESLHRGDSRDAGLAPRTSYFGRFGEELQSIDPLGRISWKTYDGRQRLKSQINPEGDSVEYAYDIRGNVLTETRKPKPNSTWAALTTTNTYYEGQTVTTCVNPAKCNKLATSQDYKARTSNYNYNSFGQLTQILGPTIGSVRAESDFCYSPQNGVSMLTGKVEVVGNSKPNRVTTLSYNGGNKYVLDKAIADPTQSLTAACAVTTKSLAQNLITTFTFDAVGNVRTIDGPRTDVNDISTYTFNDMRRLKEVDVQLASDSQYGVTKYEYYPDGSLWTTSRKDVVAGVTNWRTETRAYLPNGALQTVIDPELNVTRTDYDVNGRVNLVTDPDGRRVGTVYDAAGQTLCLWKGWNTATAPTNCTWNPATYASSGNNGPYRYVSYDSYSLNGKPLLVSDANNNTTQSVYDKFDRLRYTMLPSPSSGSRCTPATAETVSTLTCPTGATYEELRYSTSGAPTTTAAALCNGNDAVCIKRTRKGDTLTYTYDTMNRVATKTATSLPMVTFAYNLLSEPLSLTSPSQTSPAIPAHNVTYDYNDVGRKSFEKNTLNGTVRQVTYGYDAAGNRSSTTWPDNYVVSYQYDDLNRMTKVWEGAPNTIKLADYDYDTLSRRQGLQYAGQPNNKMSYTYELDSNLDVLTNVLNNTTVTLDYGHNRSGQITTIDANDNFYLPSPSTTASSAYVPNKLNQYGTVGGQALTYDASGNMLTWFPTGGKHTYTYDSENRLRTAAVNGSATATITYDYDALGRRLSKNITGTGATYYLLDGDEEIAEYNSSGVVQRRYITGPAIDDRIARFELVGATPGKVYYHTNHQGSVIDMTDGAGTITQQLAYDEYGNLTSQQPPASTTGEQFRYTGRRFDVETGLYYYRARYYSPQIGRFLQTDPIGYKADANLYTYVGNDPFNHSDPTGLCPDACVLEAVGTAAIYYSLAAVVAVGGCVEYCGGVLSKIEDLAASARDKIGGMFSSSDKPAAAPAADTPKEDKKKDPPNPNGSKGGQEHQDKIKDRAKELEAQGHTIEGGGGVKPEETVRTPGGNKESRRPDITTTDPEGNPYRENVGRTNKDGTPVSRERKAQDDIRSATGQCAFSSYTSC